MTVWTVFRNAALALLACTTGASSAARDTACDNGASFVRTGQLSGSDAVALVVTGGGSGGAFSVRIFAEIGSWGVVDLGEIKPLISGGNGDRMGAFLAGGFAYVDNALYLPGEYHAGSTHLAVQRFSIQRYGDSKPTLVRDGVAVVRIPRHGTCWAAAIRKAEQTAHFAATAVFNDGLLRDSP
jgi:hypothetical protein